MENKEEEIRNKSPKKTTHRKKKIDLVFPSLKKSKELSRNKNTNKSREEEDNKAFNQKEFLTQEKEKEKHPKKRGNEIRKFENIYSPRTTFVMQQEEEEKLFQDLGGGFDPITIKIMSYIKIYNNVPKKSAKNIYK